MQYIKCIIVDDEPIARDLLVDYCAHINNLEVVAVCSDALAAREILLSQQIDLIFLDINMPVLDGISFLKTINDPPQVIFTTAYREFALTAFDVAACDYLLKPFSLDRFIQAVDKAIRHHLIPQVQTDADHEYIQIKVENKTYNVKKDEILFFEAKENYTHVFLDEQILKPKMALSAFEKLMAPPLFVRVHRSFIINKTKINYIEGNRILIGKNEIPIGSSFKENFLSSFKV